MTDKKTKNTTRCVSKLSLGIIVLCAGLLFGQIILSNRMATKGKGLAQLKQEIEQLEADNKRLRAQQAEQVSLRELADSAAEAGFVKNPPVVVLPQDQTVAFRQ